jgi:hypothetical protein
MLVFLFFMQACIGPVFWLLLAEIFPLKIHAMARSETKRAQAEADFPELPVYGSLAELLDAGVDAVTITTPPHTRRDRSWKLSKQACMWCPISPDDSAASGWPATFPRGTQGR